ncbi:hypothetical protein O9H85_08815 [Paenibacillus filicis]|uniref:Uncharacterized protein n=1 Tax=Paenibacillus gyeongsangnamensis TaxID=3388067 RepID=A0ABT4Q6L6_9BACL|nr:hypothetical protein [Paenibacillus filicis]MCZ8512516.1 hypothetical protein [Paenibacillus filicis]
MDRTAVSSYRRLVCRLDAWRKDGLVSRVGLQLMGRVCDRRLLAAAGAAPACAAGRGELAVVCGRTVYALLPA